MSTKALKQLVDAVQFHSPHAADVRCAEEARKELEAFRKAARAIEAWQSAPADLAAERVRLAKEAEQAFELLSAIAKEAGNG